MHNSLSKNVIRKSGGAPRRGDRVVPPLMSEIQKHENWISAERLYNLLAYLIWKSLKKK